MFQDLAVVGLGATAKYKDSVGSIFNPSVILDNLKSSRHPPVRDILSGFNGAVRPGEMLRAFFLALPYVVCAD
jgi:ATP-binding cassette subfamily G (WHITE) protein 2 (SNQ2)